MVHEDKVSNYGKVEATGSASGTALSVENLIGLRCCFNRTNDGPKLEKLAGIASALRASRTVNLSLVRPFLRLVAGRR